MDLARLCLSSRTVTLAPHAAHAEDRGGRVRGFVELNCNASAGCDIEALRVRLVGLSQSRTHDARRAAEAMKRKDVSPATHFGGTPTTTFFMREAKLQRVQGATDDDQGSSYEDDDDSSLRITSLAHGKHVFAFDIPLPLDAPATQLNAFRKVYYELILVVRGRPHGRRNFLRLGFSFSPVERVKVVLQCVWARGERWPTTTDQRVPAPSTLLCSPSRTGERGLNAINTPFQPVFVGQDALYATLNSNNARWGGCFHLVLRRPLGSDGERRIRDVDVALTLEQCWVVNGERVQDCVRREQIADRSALRREKTEKAPSEKVTTAEPSAASSLSDVKHTNRASNPQHQRGGSDAQSGPLIQSIEYHAYFPDSSVQATDDKTAAPTALTPLGDWQSSSPVSSNDTVRIEHSLALVVRYVDDDNGAHAQEVRFAMPICLVNESMKTDALQLPNYASLYPSVTNDPPPPAIDAVVG